MEEKNLEAEDLAGIYKEIAIAMGVENAKGIHKLLRGQQVIFPQRLYNKEYIRNYIRKNYNGHNVRELSQMFGYSDRRIRQILNERVFSVFRGEILLKAEDLAGIYKEIASVMGVETAKGIHKLLKGQQVIFPQRLYNKEYIRNYIRENYNGCNIRELSQMFGYSDRRIRQILNEQD